MSRSTRRAVGNVVTEYEQATKELLQAEHELMLQRETVAQLRRDLPPGPVMSSYRFHGPEGPVQLDDLVGARPLVVYHFMFGERQAVPCPMCAMWADGWNAVAHHLDKSVDFVLLTGGEWKATEAMVAERGWSNLRWFAAGDSGFKTDVGGQDADGNQWPHISVYERDGAVVRRSYSGSASLLEGHGRGLDLLSPVWHFLDLTRVGRGDWMPG